MHKIDIKESQKLLLDIAEAMDNVARKHNIPFFMIAGTMLGAIRHKGFIPWDDDMDFGTTYDHYWEFIDLLEKELPKRYRVDTYETDENHYRFFFKVEDTNTIRDDKSVNLPLEKKQGISVDVFPMVCCSNIDIDGKKSRVHEIFMVIRRSYINSTDGRWYKNFAKSLIRVFMRKKPKQLLRDMKNVIDSINPGDYYCNIASPRYWNYLWKKSIYDDLEEYTFLDRKFYGPKDYETFLATQYGDYMKLPSVEKQRIHGDAVYIK